MGLFDRKSKSKQRVPDLSRYSQHNTHSSNRDSIVSTGAAASALRTHSLTSSSYNPHNAHFNAYQQQRQPPARTLSMASHRANSMSALSGNRYSGMQRSNSLTSNSSCLSHPEKIIIRTTKTKDQYGRTTSITTETIRQLGSYELVKKETKDVSMQPPPSVHHTGGYAGSLMDNELGSILEEVDDDDHDHGPVTGGRPASFQPMRAARVNTEYDQDRDSHLQPPLTNGELNRSKSPVRSILKNGDRQSSSREKRVTVIGEDEEISDGGSVYSDALDTLPKQHRQLKKRTSNSTLDNVKVSEDTRFAAKVNKTDRSSARFSAPIQPRQGASVPNNGNQLSEEELYQLAYQAALKKVYGESSGEAPQEPKRGGFKSYSLRGENPMQKTKNSPRVSTSRTSSLTSITKRPFFLPQSQESSSPSTPIQNPTHSPEMEPTPKYSFDRASPGTDSPVQQEHREMGLGIQSDSQILQPAAQVEPQAVEQVSPPPPPQQIQPPPSTKQQKKVRRKTSLSKFFQHPAMRYHDIEGDFEAPNIFRKHSMRGDTPKHDSTTKNYNYQLSNKFTSNGPTGDVSQAPPGAYAVGGSPSVLVDGSPVADGAASVVITNNTKMNEKKKKKFNFGSLFKSKKKVEV